MARCSRSTLKRAVNLRQESYHNGDAEAGPGAVGKNIAPLQNKGMLAYDVLNAGQLKNYLNADW